MVSKSATGGGLLKTQDVKQSLCTAIQEMIIRGDLLPGERLPESELCKTFGVSRPSLREAFALLQHRGLVVLKPRCGASIPRPSLDEIRELCEYRAHLEDMAVREALPHLEDEDFQAMEQCLRKLQAATLAESIEDVLAADTDFHSCLYEKTSNRFLCFELKNLSVKAKMYSFMYKKRHSLFSLTYERHQHLLTAYRSGDLEHALLSTRQHVTRHLLEGGRDYISEI